MLFQDTILNNSEIEFDNIETARKFYESEKYQAAKAVREMASDTDLILVEGMYRLLGTSCEPTGPSYNT